MAQLLNIQKQEVEDVPDEAVTQAVASGAYGLPKGRVQVTDPSGRRATIDAQEAPEWFGKGFGYVGAGQLEEERKEKEYGDRPGAAFLEGGLRGATLSLSDLALRKLDLVSREHLKEVQERNPVASTAGEVTGAVGSAFVPGVGEALPASLAARAGVAAERVAGEALGKGLAGRALASGVGGGVEGSLWGLGTAASNVGMDNPQLAGEKALAGVGLNSLLGFAGGAGARLIGEGLGAGVRAAGEKAADALEDLPAALRARAEEKALKGAGANQALLKQIPESQRSKIGRDILDHDLFKPEKAQAALEESGSKMGELLDAADEATGDGGFDSSGITKRIQDELLGPAKGNPVRTRKIQGILKKYGLDDLEALGDEGRTFAKANEIKTDLANDTNYTDTKLTSRIMKKLGGIVDDEVEQQLSGALGADKLQEYVEAKGLYGSSKEAAKLLQKKAERETGNNALSLNDRLSSLGLLTAAGAHGASGGTSTLLAAGAGLANKLLRENGPRLEAQFLDKLAESPALQRAATGLKSFVQGAMERSPEALGAYGGLLANAAANSDAELLATHSLLAQHAPDYKATLAQAGLDATPQSDADGMKQAAGMARIDAGLSRIDGRANDAIGALLEKKQPPARQPPGLEATKAAAQQVLKLTANPNQLVDALAHATTQLGQVSPEMAATIHETATRAAQYLASIAPKPPQPPLDVPGLQRPWRPSDVEMQRFQKQLSAVTDPYSVLEDMAHGAVTKSAVDALRNVYPQLYEDTKAKLLDRLASHGTALDYRQRLALGQVLGMPLDASAQPQNVSAWQQLHAQQPQKSTPPSQQKPPQLSQQSMTGTEALMSRRLQ